MKYAIILLALISLPACGQNGATSVTGTNTFVLTPGQTAPIVAVGKTWPYGGIYPHQRPDPGPCLPSVDTKPEDDLGSSDVFRCDAKTKLWTRDPELSRLEKIREDKAVAEAQAKENHRRDLVRALTTRVLTEKEYGDVLELGPSIYGEGTGACAGMCTEWQMQQYAHDYYLQKRFDDELLIQFKLRAIAAQRVATCMDAPNCCDIARNSTAICRPSGTAKLEVEDAKP